MTANKILQSNIGKLRENCNDDLRLSISELTPIIRLDFKRPEIFFILKIYSCKFQMSCSYVNLLLFNNFFCSLVENSLNHVKHTERTEITLIHEYRNSLKCNNVLRIT